jgi:hypothetical protein
MGAVRSAMNVTASTFTHNMADSWQDADNHGGAIWAHASVATIHDCAFSDNFAAGCGTPLCVHSLETYAKCSISFN